VGCIGLGIILLLLLPAFLLLVFFQVVTISFAKLGLSEGATVMLVILSVVGSMINIPLSRRRIALEEPARPRSPFSFLFYNPPRVRRQTIAINVGGAIVPIVFSIYLLATVRLCGRLSWPRQWWPWWPS